MAPKLQPNDSKPPPPLSVTSTVSVKVDHVRRQLVRLYSGKAAGPDFVNPRGLKACAPQLYGVLHQAFSMSLSRTL